MREGALEDLVAAGGDAGEGPRGGDRGPHAEEVVLGAVGFGDGPAGEVGGTAGGTEDLGDVCVGAGGRRTDDRAETVVLDHGHHGLGVADRTGTGEEGDPA